MWGTDLVLKTWGTELVLKTHAGYRSCFEDMWGTELVLKTHVGHRACFEDTLGHRAWFGETCGAQSLFLRHMWGTDFVLKTCGAQSLFWRHKEAKHRHFRFSQLSGRHLHRLTLQDSWLLGSEDRGSTILRHVGSLLRVARCKSQKN